MITCDALSEGSNIISVALRVSDNSYEAWNIERFQMKGSSSWKSYTYYRLSYPKSKGKL